MRLEKGISTSTEDTHEDQDPYPHHNQHQTRPAAPRALFVMFTPFGIGHRELEMA